MGTHRPRAIERSPKRMTMRLSHDHAFMLAATPVAACIMQYLERAECSGEGF